MPVQGTGDIGIACPVERYDHIGEGLGLMAHSSWLMEEKGEENE